MKNLGNITKSLPKILLYIGLGAVLIMNIILAFVMLAPRVAGPAPKCDHRLTLE